MLYRALVGDNGLIPYSSIPRCRGVQYLYFLWMRIAFGAWLEDISLRWLSPPTITFTLLILLQVIPSTPTQLLHTQLRTVSCSLPKPAASRHIFHFFPPYLSTLNLLLPAVSFISRQNLAPLESRTLPKKRQETRRPWSWRSAAADNLLLPPPSHPAASACHRWCYCLWYL